MGYKQQQDKVKVANRSDRKERMEKIYEQQYSN